MEVYTKFLKDDLVLITLSNAEMQLTFINFGCTITAIRIGEKNVVLAYDKIEDYFDDRYYLGCVVGRVTGRISQGRFNIGGDEYPLAKNDPSGKHHLHGGVNGFSKKKFHLTGSTQTEHAASATLQYKSPHLEEGYPGNLDVTVTYTMTAKNEIVIEYRAQTDRATHVNLTNHTYFNFSSAAPAVDTHELFVDADRYVVSNADFIPTGELRSVNNDIHDFRKIKPVRRNLNECFVLNGDRDDDRIKAALHEPASNISMTVRTTVPGLLFYTGDYLTGDFVAGQGLCLETQFFPDTPNRPEFSGTLLRPGQTYYQRTSLGFYF